MPRIKLKYQFLYTNYNKKVEEWNFLTLPKLYQEKQTVFVLRNFCFQRNDCLIFGAVKIVSKINKHHIETIIDIPLYIKKLQNNKHFPFFTESIKQLIRS